MKQRVGIARALAMEPKVLLMDEPFGAVDPINREMIQNEFFEMQRALNKTVIMVSHDIDEAIKLGDKIAIFRAGEVYNVGGWNEKPNLEIVNRVCALLDELRPRADGKPYAEQITYVTDRPGLQHIEVIGHAGHRPAGHVQCQLLGLHGLHKGLESLAVGCQVALRRRQRRQATGALGKALEAVAQSLGLLDVGAQGKRLLVLAQAQQVGIELRQLAQTVEALANAVQGSNADGRHCQGKYQHQGKAQAEFAGHAQVGQHTVLARAHRRLPFCV